MDYVRQRSKAFLDEQPEERRTAILRGAMVSREIAGKAAPPSMKEIEPATQKQRKQEVRFLAQRSYDQGGFLGQKLRVGERYFGMDAAPSLVFEDETGHIFGVIPKKHALDWLVGEMVVI
jgi:hypothetical protein